MNRKIYLAILFLSFLTSCQGQNDKNSKIAKTEHSISIDTAVIKEYFLPIDTAFIPSNNKQFYFPLEVFKDTSIYVGHDKFVDTWYSQNLYAMHEPIFYADKSEKEIYRFTWLRTFHNPISIRIEKNGDIYTLYWKLCNGAGGYDPGELTVNTQKKIDREIWNEFQKHLNQINFWRMSTNEMERGEDGSQWILEGKIAKKYHVVDRWTPNKESNYYQCCDFLLRLTDLKIKESDKY